MESPDSSSSLTSSNSSEVLILNEIEQIKLDINILNQKIDKLYDLILKDFGKEKTPTCFNGFRCNVGVNTGT